MTLTPGPPAFVRLVPLPTVVQVRVRPLYDRRVWCGFLSVVWVTPLRQVVCARVDCVWTWLAM